MTNFNYNYNIPAANNNPSADQPLMLENYQSIHDWAEVDHVGYEVANGGTHKLVTFNNVASPVAPSDPVSIAYTTNDVAGKPNLFFKNSQAAMMISCVKAFGVFPITTNNANVTVLNSFGINSTITKPGPGTGTYVISLNTNIVTGDNVIVFRSTNRASTNFDYTFSAGILTLQLTGVGSGTLGSFIILQA